MTPVATLDAMFKECNSYVQDQGKRINCGISFQYFTTKRLFCWLLYKKLFRYSQDKSDRVLIQTVLIKAQILNQNSCSRQYRLDSDKHMLAKQTGLNLHQTQVSNWFINA